MNPWYSNPHPPPLLCRSFPFPSGSTTSQAWQNPSVSASHLLSSEISARSSCRVRTSTASTTSKVSATRRGPLVSSDWRPPNCQAAGKVQLARFLLFRSVEEVCLATVNTVEFHQRGPSQQSFWSRTPTCVTRLFIAWFDAGLVSFRKISFCSFWTCVFWRPSPSFCGVVSALVLLSRLDASAYFVYFCN